MFLLSFSQVVNAIEALESTRMELFNLQSDEGEHHIRAICIERGKRCRLMKTSLQNSFIVLLDAGEV